MTAQDSTSPPAVQAVDGDTSRRAPLSITALISFAGGVVLLLLHSVVRVASAVVFDDDAVAETVSLVLGTLGLLSLLPIVLNIVLGHVGMAVSGKGRKSGRTLAVAGATLGYVLLGLYINRLVVVVVVMTTQGNSIDQFAQHFFWWL